jgi:hypothetical protein
MYLLGVIRMIKLSDLLFGRKVMVSGDQIIDNDVADCAHITFYPLFDQHNWYMEIRGEIKNKLTTFCTRCNEAFVDIVFDADGVRGEYLCFHCREYLKHKEVSE